MRRWLWVLCLVACSRRIEHFHDLDAGIDSSVSTDSPMGCAQSPSPLGLACAQAGFGTPTALPGEAHAMSRVADLNADGKLDLISTEVFRGRVAVSFGRGDGTFQSPSYYMTVSSPVALDVGDLDNDGDRDIVVGSLTATTLSILLNAGNGTFTAAPSLTVSTARSIVIAHMNGDTRPDLVVLGASDAPSVSIVIATPTGYATPVTYNPGFAANAAAVGDLDNDGDLDVVAIDGGSPTSAAILKNSGAGAFTIATTSLTEGANDVVIADINGDGNRDLVIASAFTIYLLPGSGLGTFGSASTFTVRATRLAVADLDNDGKLDIAAVGSDGLTVITHGQTGYVQRLVPLEMPGHGPEQVTTGDVDGNGLIDLVTSSTTNYENGVLILRNTGVVPTPTALATGVTASGLIGDLDGDGRNDFIRVMQTGFQVFRQASGSLVTDNVVYPATGTFAIGQVTGSRDPDIVVAWSEFVTVFMGTGQGRFMSVARYAIGGFASEVYIADLDGDCAAEIVLVHPAGTGVHAATIAVMRNRGDGTFDPEVVYPVPGLVSATLGDFDEDGRLDVVASASSQIAFLHGTVDGRFADPVSRTYTTFEQLASADLDGDGHRDLVGSLNNSLATVRGHGDGSFDEVALQRSMTLTTTGTMRVFDFDGDGTLDVVFSNNIGVGIHIGHADGTFDPVRIYQLPGRPLAVGDLSDDKRADVVFYRDAQNEQPPVLFEFRGSCGL